jgi:hypothetical protein
MAVAVSAVYGLVLILLRYFDDSDLQVIERFMPIPRILHRSSLFSGAD